LMGKRLSRWLTERVNGGGTAAGIWRGWRSEGGADGKVMGGLPVGCSE
jgi:hypothetical protein